MKIKNRLLVSAAMTMAVGCAAALAQAPSAGDAAAIDAAVAAYLRPSLPKSGVTFETRVREGQSWVESRSAARIAAFARAINGVPVHRDTVAVCASHSPSSCTLRNATTLLSFTDAVVTGNSAVVQVMRIDLSGIKRIPLNRKEVELHLTRTAAGWQVTEERFLSIS